MRQAKLIFNSSLKYYYYVDIYKYFETTADGKRLFYTVIYTIEGSQHMLLAKLTLAI